MSSRTAETLLRATLARLDPGDAVASALAKLELDGEVVVWSMGKAAVAMARGARRVLGDRIASELVVAPEIPAHAADGWIEASHPRPDARSEAAGRALLASARATKLPVLALVSGGASSLVAVPADGLRLDDKVAACQAVYAAGADIVALNTVRKHLSAIKGGRLAAACATAVTTLVASDVVGDDLAAVGSGPTLADSTTLEDARRVVAERTGWRGVPAAVRRHLEGGATDTPSAPRPGDRACCVAGVASLVAAAAAEAETRFRVVSLGAELGGDVVEVAERFAAAVRAAAPGTCVVAGGEATIELGDRPGRGGRAHHMALLLARDFAGARNLEILCAGSDGLDGNSGAAGAIVDGATFSAIERAGLDPERRLVDRDSATALAAVDAQVVTGPTGVNHCDLLLALVL